MEPVSLLLGGGALLAVWALGSGCQDQFGISFQELRFNRENLSKNQVPYDKLAQNEDRFFLDRSPNSRISHLIKPGLDGRREGRWVLENRGAESKSWEVGWEVTVHGLQSDEGWMVTPDQLRLCNPYMDPITGSPITIHTESGPKIINSIPPTHFLQGGINLTCCNAGDIALMRSPGRLSENCTTVPVEDILSFGSFFGDQNTLGCKLRGTIPDSMIKDAASCQLEFNQDAFPHTKIDAPLELMTIQRIEKGSCIERGIEFFYEASRSSYTGIQNPITLPILMCANPRGTPMGFIA